MDKARLDKLFSEFTQRGAERVTPKRFFGVLSEIENARKLASGRRKPRRATTDKRH